MFKWKRVNFLQAGFLLHNTDGSRREPRHREKVHKCLIKAGQYTEKLIKPDKGIQNDRQKLRSATYKERRENAGTLTQGSRQSGTGGEGNTAYINQGKGENSPFYIVLFKDT